MKIASIKGWITSVFNICRAITYNQDLLSSINLAESSTIDFDLGVICSCIDNFNKGRVKIFTIKLGNRITPSFVAFTDEERFVREVYKNQPSLSIQISIYDFKRLIRRNYNEKEVQ